MTRNETTLATQCCLIIVLLSCSTINVLEKEGEPGFNLKNYSTFNFFEVEGSGDTTGNFASHTEQLIEAITSELQSKGLRLSQDNADLLINIGIVVQEKVQTRQTDIRDAPRYMGQRRYSWKSEEVEVNHYRKGTVTIELVESGPEKMVWKGVAEGVIPEKDRKLKEAIQDGVKTLFADL